MQYLTFEGKSFQEAYDKMYKDGIETNNLKNMQIIRKFEEEQSRAFGLKKEKIYKILVGVHEKNFEEPQENKPKIITPSSTLSSTPNVSRPTNMDKKLASASSTKEIEEIKKSMKVMQHSIIQELNDVKENLIRSQRINLMSEESSSIEDLDLSKKNLNWAEDFLFERDFAPSVVRDVIAFLQEEPISSLLDRKSLVQEIYQFFKMNLTEQPLSLDHYEQYGSNILFAGPTGVGKTITTIKMAAHIAAMRKKSVRFISVDRYKVGAESQMKIYAGYLQAPFYVIHKEEEFFDLVMKKETDYTFIDTAGKSPRETIAIKELCDWVKKMQIPLDIHLVVSATTKAADLFFIYDHYKYLNFNHIITTKLDETVYYGSILSLLYKSKAPLSFVTNGQEVPQDFELADLDRLIQESLK